MFTIIGLFQFKENWNLIEIWGRNDTLYEPRLFYWRGGLHKADIREKCEGKWSTKGSLFGRLLYMYELEGYFFKCSKPRVSKIKKFSNAENLQKINIEKYSSIIWKFFIINKNLAPMTDSTRAKSWKNVTRFSQSTVVPSFCDIDNFL